MKNRSARTRAGLALGVALVAAAVLAATLAQGAGAKPGPAVVVKTAAHSCLVMTGSGDPAFVRNFNPYTATSLPSGGFVKGAFYEPLVIATAAGGGHLYPWLATSWKWSNGAKTLTLAIKPGVKWSDGKPLTAADVVYSLKAGRPEQGRRPDRPRARRHEHRLGPAEGPVRRRDQPEDAGLAVHRCAR